MLRASKESHTPNYTNLITVAKSSCRKLSMKVNAREKISSGKRGTTIIVRNMFRRFPVRLAQMKKHPLPLGKVKSVLLTYALVREIRVSLQMRGNRKVDWTVQRAPHALGVATAVYGKDLMQLYQSVSCTGEGVTIDGIVPNPKICFQRFGHTSLDTILMDKQIQTHYIYIDNRPVSTICNPAKHLVKLLRESYPASTSLQNLFLYLNIHCNPEKIRYDFNLDHTKSVVVFERFEVVIQCFQAFLGKVHGTNLTRSPSPAFLEFFPHRPPSPPPSSPPTVRNDGDETNKTEMKRSIKRSRPDITPIERIRPDERINEYSATQSGTLRFPKSRSRQDTADLASDRAGIQTSKAYLCEMNRIDLTHFLVSGRQMLRVGKDGTSYLGGGATHESRRRSRRDLRGCK